MTTGNYAVAGVTASPPGGWSPAALLVATGIEKSYGSGLWPLRHHQEVLRDASLSLLPGEVVGLVGENGSGKDSRRNNVGFQV